MYTRCNVFKHLARTLLFPNLCSRLIRPQPLAINITTAAFQDFGIVNHGQVTAEDIFLDLTTDYNRKRFVNSGLLTNAIENINSNISERLSLLILTAAARCVHHVSPEKRVELLEEAWKTLNEKKVRLTTRHYETYLSGLNENGFIFDADYYLKLIDNEQIQATPRLYSLLLTQYCREGNTDRAQNFLKMLKERNVSVDEDIFAALIVCQLKLGNDKGANDIIQIMKERGLQPTISTYKEILIALISEHKLDQFEYYFGQIESQQNNATTSSSSSSTLYIDAHFVVLLLGQCVSYKERPIFDVLLQSLRELDHGRIPNNLFNLAVQCVSNGWHESAVELLQMQSEIEHINNEVSPYHGIHGRHWVLFFKQLFESDDANLTDIYLELMMQKNLMPLDAILRAFYIDSSRDFRLALTYLESGQQIRHPMRTNYFYPLLLNAYSSQTRDKWTDDDRLRLFRLLDRLAIPIESSTYSRLIQKSFHEFYGKDFRPLLTMLTNNGLEAILDRICRLILIDIRQKTAELNIIEQIAPHFRLQTRTRQEEFARHLFSIMAGVAPTSNESEAEDDHVSASPILDLTPLFSLIDSICTNLAADVPLLKRELYIQLLRLSSQHRRSDIAAILGQQCVNENVKIGGSMNEIDTLTGYTLSRDIVEQLARYKPGEKSWKEKLASIDVTRTSRSKLEQIYTEAKHDGRHPVGVQQRLLEIYVQGGRVDEAFTILREIVSSRFQIAPQLFHQLFSLVTIALDDTTDTSKAEHHENLKLLCDLYGKSGGIINLPPELTFRVAHMHILAGDLDSALKVISDKINYKFDNETLHYLLQFLRKDATLLTVDGLTSIGRLILNFRSSEPIRKFWNIFFDIFLEKTSPQDVVQFYSDAMRQNSNVPYMHLFELFVEKNELNRLQDIVDMATLQHGPQNVLHDLAFVLIRGEKIKQAERIFQTPWLKARNDRINLHALFFADSNNLDGLIHAINLTHNLPGVNQKQLFTSAIRVAIRTDRSDIVDWLVKEIEQNNVLIGSRVKKFLDAHLMSKGLQASTIEVDDGPHSQRDKQNHLDEDVPEQQQQQQQYTMSAQS